METEAARLIVPVASSIVSVRAMVNTAPTGAAIIVDILKNGTTIWGTNPGNRPTIAISGNDSGNATFRTRVAGRRRLSPSADRAGRLDHRRRRPDGRDREPPLMATYYVANAGRTPTTALEFDAVQDDRACPGRHGTNDTVLLNRGDRWFESLTLPNSGITVDTYGAAATFDGVGYCTNAPVLDGGSFVTARTSYTGGAPDTYISDDFAGTSGAALTTSTPEIGTGTSAEELGLGTMVISSDGMARRANAVTQAMYAFSEEVLAAGRLSRNRSGQGQNSRRHEQDIARIMCHVNTSAQGYAENVRAEIQVLPGGDLFEVGWTDGSAQIGQSVSISRPRCRHDVRGHGRGDPHVDEHDLQRLPERHAHGDLQLREHRTRRVL